MIRRRRFRGTRATSLSRRANLAALFLALTLTGCAATLTGERVEPGTPQSPAHPWLPPPDMRESEPASGGASSTAPRRPDEYSIPPELMARSGQLTLADLIDVALRNNTLTQQTWAQARSVAADLGAERSRVWPVVDLETTAQTARGAVGGGLFTFRSTTWGPNLLLSWLLYDSGGRAADIDAAREALIAADWTHNQAIQDVVLAVQSEYYRYVGSKALLSAQQSSVKESQTALDAATARHEAGVATIADVLQAKTSLSQAQLALQEIEGQVLVIRGSLATTLGLPASAARSKFDVAIPEGPLPIRDILEDVDRFIERAEADRPDLAAARSQVAASEARVRSARAAERPAFFADANAGRIFYTGGPDPNDATQTWSAVVGMHLPIFNGGRLDYNRLRAEADTELSRARLEDLRQRVVFDVWSSYTDVQTETRRVTTAADLLASAEQSEEVASGRYKAGVGSILDLLTAQRQLLQARASEVLARTGWAIALARLAHDSGAAGLQAVAAGSAPPAPDDGTQP